MSGAIHQMQVSFAPAQDRLLFRFNTTDQCEFSFWFTRRYVKQLWPVLLQMLEAAPDLPRVSAPQAKSAVLAFQHEQVMTQADFATPYREPPAMQRPLGAEPVLAARIQIKPGPGAQQSLCLHPEQGRGVELALDARLTHLFCRLLMEGIKQSDWDLSYELARDSQPVDKMRVN
jgi:hypothetical protein